MKMYWNTLTYHEIFIFSGSDAGVLELNETLLSSRLPVLSCGGSWGQLVGRDVLLRNACYWIIMIKTRYHNASPPRLYESK